MDEVEDVDEVDLADIGTFCVQPTPAEPRYEPDDPLPSHRLVLDPLLGVAEHARVMGEGRDPLVEPLLVGVSTRRRGHLELDLTQELVRGRERVWNTEAWGRGAIVIVCEPTRVDLGGVFQYCDGPWLWTSRYQMQKASPRAALGFADRVAAEGRLAFLFSASNGAEWLDVFAPEGLLQTAYDTAVARCRRFKRFVEHNPGATDEIIVDRPPYKGYAEAPAALPGGRAPGPPTAGVA
jgi:hypothetical protein